LFILNSIKLSMVKNWFKLFYLRSARARAVAGKERSLGWIWRSLLLQLRSLRHQKVSWLAIAVAIEIFLAIAYVSSTYINGGKPSPLWDYDAFRSIPSWMQGVQLLCLGAVPLWLLVTYRQPLLPPSRGLLAIASLLFLYAAIDEVMKFHLTLGHHLWRFIYGGVGLALTLCFWADFRRLWQFHPRALRWMAIGVVVFLVCAFGLELFRVYVQQRYWYQIFGRWKFYEVDAIRTALEESGELLGESLMLQGVILLAKRRITVTR
jgi:hypothetical protein